jgi:HlyD family secretion protein
MDVIAGQQRATGASLAVQKSGLLAEALPLQKQIEQVDDQIARCRIINPLKGVVLVRYAEPGEIAAPGKPLYKLADLEHMELRAYVAGDQLGSVAVGQAVRVLTDAPDGSYREHAGRVVWVAGEAEFTPKVIQTRDERVNLVYAVRIAVDNPDGALKIGMPGEVKFQNP